MNKRGLWPDYYGLYNGLKQETNYPKIIRLEKEIKTNYTYLEQAKEKVPLSSK